MIGKRHPRLAQSTSVSVYNFMSYTVAIIPARAGSKGVPGKNLVKLCGKPLLAWSILQARSAKHIDAVWVTSDGDDVLAIARKYGAGTIKRPENISGDTASSESAWWHAIEYIEAKTDKRIDIVIGMQATSPMREAKDLDEAVITYRKGCFDSLLSVSKIEDFFVWEENSKGEFVSVNYDYRDRKPRQLIKNQYRENGSFYIFTPELINSSGNRLGGRIGKYVMDFYKMFQIDSFEDIRICEVLMSGYGLDDI